MLSGAFPILPWTGFRFRSHCKAEAGAHFGKPPADSFHFPEGAAAGALQVHTGKALNLPCQAGFVPASWSVGLAVLEVVS